MTAGWFPDVAVVGVGGTPIARRSGPVLSLAVDAAAAAVADAGVALGDIDGFFGSPHPPNPGPNVDGFDVVSARLLAHTLGKDDACTCDVVAMFGSAIAQACQHLAVGTCTYALVVRAIGHPPVAEADGSGEPVHGDVQFTMPYGLGPVGGRHALWWQRYMHEFGATRDDLFAVVECERRHALENERAYWRNRPITRNDYFEARWVCEPLSLYDCDMPVAGAVALVLTTGERAGAHANTAFINFVADGANPERALHEAGLAPYDIQVAQLYDGFSPFVFQWLERLGFAEPGRARFRIADGALERGGTIPTNTFGGSLGEGRLHGAGHIREAVLQAMGRAGSRQIAGVEHSLALVGIPESAALIVMTPERQRTKGTTNG